MAKVTMRSVEEELNRLGLVSNGKTQRFATNEAMRLMNPYVPTMNNALRQSARVVDGGTATLYASPYAHYQYRGILYVDPITKKGSFFSEKHGHWSRPGVNKVKTNIPLKYSNPNASAEWDKKMLKEKGNDYFKSIQQFLDKGFSK